MQVVQGFSDRAAYRGGWVAIGNFDGVHRGHREMIAALVRHARRAGVRAVVFTFEPHPISLLRPAQMPPAITTLSRKLELLEETGVDTVLVYPTDRTLLEMTARQFFDAIVIEEFHAAGLVEGPNFCFGRGREGDIAMLQEFCRASQRELVIVSPVTVGAKLVSSSVVRNLLVAGAVATAAELLGTPYRLRGLVGHGAERGRTIGFPTANLFETPTVLPAEGVYAGRALVAGRGYAAAINIGANPTFGEQARKIEVHLLDFSGNLYDRWLDVDFLVRLRETRPFPSREALINQLQADIAQTRSLAGNVANG